MTKKLYNLMDWAAIEGIVYSEEDEPHDILGPHKVSGGILFQMFYPDATKAALVIGKTTYKMELADEAGFFAVLLPKSTDYKGYYYTVETESGITKDIYDPYMFDPFITMKDTDQFNLGLHSNAYDILGAHVMSLEGVKGVLFAVWAPNAQRVSVVGDFNNWDGRMHQMRRLWDSGIFELFVPCAHVNDNYKFEIKLKNGTTYMKADPYATCAQLRPETASIVYELPSFKWTDAAFLKNRTKLNAATSPRSIYTLSLGLFDRKEDGGFYTYKELAPKVASYVSMMGYTHIDLMPVMEHPSDESLGYKVIGAFAPTARYGSPEDFMYFVNEMHKQNIGVILDVVYTDFPKDEHGLAGFDGSCLYEHLDERKKTHPVYDTFYFNYGRNEVKNYLISNALYWISKYHIDGIRIDELAAMLYLDYGRCEGEFVTNMYGGVENLEAIAFLKELNQTIHKSYPDVITIAELNAAWPNVTASPSEDGLGFDLQLNANFTADLKEYMHFDPIYRSHHHGELTFSMVYSNRERFLLSFQNGEIRKREYSIIRRMPGEIEDKFKNLKATMAYMMVHPGAKQFYIGQDIAEFAERYSDRSVEWMLLETEEHKNVQTFVKELNAFYAQQKALYELDFSEDGFEWINSISANENVLVFLRKTKSVKDTLLVVCNFANEERSNYKIGVPFPGKYKECFNSDAKKYGGANVINSKVLASCEEECDAREDSISIKMPALSVQVFSYTEFTAKEKAEIEKKKEEERQRQLELTEIREAKQAESSARQMAFEAKEEANKAQLAAKEALKHAMAEAKKAEELEKQARELEREAMRLFEQSEQLKKNAKFIKASDFPEDEKKNEV